MDLSEKIIRYRAKHNLTQEQFAMLCGVSRLTIWNIENKKGTILMTTQLKIEMELEKDAGK